jgi:hypothetical protein
MVGFVKSVFPIYQDFGSIHNLSVAVFDLGFYFAFIVQST